MDDVPALRVRASNKPREETAEGQRAAHVLRQMKRKKRKKGGGGQARSSRPRPGREDQYAGAMIRWSDWVLVSTSSAFSA